MIIEPDRSVEGFEMKLEFPLEYQDIIQFISEIEQLRRDFRDYFTSKRAGFHITISIKFLSDEIEKDTWEPLTEAELEAVIKFISTM